MDPLPRHLVLFDGVCAVCDASMQWLLTHDTGGRLHYAPLQGPTATAVRGRHPEIPASLDSIVFVTQGPQGEQVSWHSGAILDIAAGLPAPWRWARWLRWIPAPLRDIAYRAFAAARYRVFGKLESCRIPTPDQATRFLP